MNKLLAGRKLPKAAIQWLLVGLCRICQRCQELPGAARSCPELPEAAGSCQKLPGAAGRQFSRQNSGKVCNCCKSGLAVPSACGAFVSGLG